MTLKVIISGFARGATRWAYESIKRAGHDVGFCEVFNEHSTVQSSHAAITNSKHEIEVSWFSAPFLRHPALQYNARTVYLMRDPLAIADSLGWIGMFQPGHNDLAQAWYDFAVKSAPELDVWYRGRPGQSALYYLCEWHNLLQHAKSSVHAEEGVAALLEAGGLENKTGVVYNNTRCNSSACRRSSTVESISELPVFKTFLETAKVQGYASDGQQQDNEFQGSALWDD